MRLELIEVKTPEGIRFKARGESTRKDDETLKSCPFCGGDEVLVINGQRPLYWVRCVPCKVEIEGDFVEPNLALTAAEARKAHRAAFKSAVDAWNRRSPES